MNFNSTQEEQGALFQEQKDLGIDEFHKYRVALDKARHEIRGNYERARSNEANLRNELLTKYDKLFVEEKKTLEENAETLGEQATSLKEKTVEVMNGLLSDSQKEENKNRRLQYVQLLLSECEEKDREYEQSTVQVEQLNNNLANFLHDQGKTLSSVEQAEALNTKLMRSSQRRKAHQCIINALRGFNETPDEENGLASLIADGENKSLRAQRDADDGNNGKLVTAVDQVEEELTRLEALEEHTDQLVDRLKVKLDSINLLEESQVEMVDFQVRKHTKTLQRLQDIERKVNENNEEIMILHSQMSAEFNSGLQKLSASSMSANQYYVCGGGILLIVALMFFYFVYGIVVK